MYACVSGHQKQAKMEKMNLGTECFLSIHLTNKMIYLVYHSTENIPLNVVQPPMSYK